MNEKVITHLIACKTATDMWTRIQCLYGKGSEASIHTLQQKFYAYTYKGECVAQHVADLENLRHELKGRGEEISENMLVNKILMTLPEDYKHFYSAWDSSTDKSLNTLTARLLAEEERLFSRNQSEEASSALVTKSSYKSQNSRNALVCHFCKKKLLV